MFTLAREREHVVDHCTVSKHQPVLMVLLAVDYQTRNPDPFSFFFRSKVRTTATIWATSLTVKKKGGGWALSYKGETRVS